MAEEKQGSGSGFGWFLLGLGVGAAVGVLYAPKAGTEIRDDLREQAREGGEYLKQRSRVAADQVSDIIETGKGQLKEYAGKGRQAVETGRSQWENVVDRGRRVVQDQASKVSAAVDAGKQAYKSSTEGS